MLDLYSTQLLGYGETFNESFPFDFEALTYNGQNFKDIFENKLYLFAYFPGNFNDPDMFGYNRFDIVGLFWANDKVNFVKINKNYTLCTTKYSGNVLISNNELNLFYGYNIYPIITDEGVHEFDSKPDDFKQAMATSDIFKLDLSDSVMNYTSKVFNTIKLPRNKIADGSYSFNVFLDPHFIAEGYRFDDYLKDGKDAETVQYCISQSAIRYDKDNDVFFTNAYLVENDELDISTDNDADFVQQMIANLLSD